MRDIGRVNDADYRRLRRRRLGWLPLGFCVLLGFSGGFLHGKRSHLITIDEAVETLADPAIEEWEQLQALGAIRARFEPGIALLDQWSSHPALPGANAVIYAGQIALACTKILRARLDEGGNPHDKHIRDYLTKLEKTIK